MVAYSRNDTSVESSLCIGIAALLNEDRHPIWDKLKLLESIKTNKNGKVGQNENPLNNGNLQGLPNGNRTMFQWYLNMRFAVCKVNVVYLLCYNNDKHSRPNTTSIHM